MNDLKHDHSPPDDAPFPGVSVVIPAYNYAHYLPFAINSVLRQDYPAVETIVVDDGSRDNCAEVVARYGDRVRYIRQENAGLSAARNTGIRAATHPFIAFLDADDQWRPGMLSRIMEKATRECDVEGVGLFNWYEPLLHPRLSELVKIVKSFGVVCNLSSNLNTLRNPDDLMAANPDSFRISISGFNQSNYEITHRGGDVEKVKQNMRLLADARDRTNSRTEVHVCYHRYLGNLDDEVALKRYAETLEFNFQPV